MATPSELTARRAFILLFVVSLVLLVILLKPFAVALFLAAVLAGALRPLQARFARALRGRASLTAGILTAGVILVLLVPVAGLAAFVVNEARQGYQFVAQTLQSEGVNGLLQALPDRFEGFLRALMGRFDIAAGDLASWADGQLGAQVQAQGESAARAAAGAVAATGSVVVQLVFMLIAFYFLLVDGPALVDWIEEVAPLKKGQTREILVEFRQVSVAVLVSTLATAAVQAVAALVGYFIFRVPQALFFGLVTFLFALVPAVGATAVCLVAALVLLVLGHSWSALFLAAWGLGVVGVVDNIIKPILVKRGMSLHGAVVFFALLGGLAAFGPIGLLLGPMIIAFLLALIRIHQRDFGQAPEKGTG